MSLSTNKALVKSFVEEVFNNHDILAAEKYFARENPLIGSEGFKQSLSAQFNAFPDIQTKIEHIVAENDLVVVFLVLLEHIKENFEECRQPTKK